MLDVFNGRAWFVVFEKTEMQPGDRKTIGVQLAVEEAQFVGKRIINAGDEDGLFLLGCFTGSPIAKLSEPFVFDPDTMQSQLPTYQYGGLPMKVCRTPFDVDLDGVPSSGWLIVDVENRDNVVRSFSMVISGQLVVRKLKGVRK